MMFRDLNEKYIEQEKLVIQLQATNKILAEERERFKEEKDKYEGALKEREKNASFLDEQLKLFNVIQAHYIINPLVWKRKR